MPPALISCSLLLLSAWLISSSARKGVVRGTRRMNQQSRYSCLRPRRRRRRCAQPPPLLRPPVQDLDKLEMIMQAHEYERDQVRSSGDMSMSAFFLIRWLLRPAASACGTPCYAFICSALNSKCVHTVCLCQLGAFRVVHQSSPGACLPRPQGMVLEEFFTSTEGRFQTPFGKALAQEIVARRASGGAAGDVPPQGPGSVGSVGRAGGVSALEAAASAEAAAAAAEMAGKAGEADAVARAPRVDSGAGDL